MRDVSGLRDWLQEYRHGLRAEVGPADLTGIDPDDLARKASLDAARVSFFGTRQLMDELTEQRSRCLAGSGLQGVAEVQAIDQQLAELEAKLPGLEADFLRAGDLMRAVWMAGVGRRQQRLVDEAREHARQRDAIHAQIAEHQQQIAVLAEQLNRPESLQRETQLQIESRSLELNSRRRVTVHLGSADPMKPPSRFVMPSAWARLIRDAQRRGLVATIDVVIDEYAGSVTAVAR